MIANQQIQGGGDFRLGIGVGQDLERAGKQRVLGSQGCFGVR